MDIRKTSPDGRIVWVEFPRRSRDDDRAPEHSKVYPPGSRRAPRGNPELDGKAFARCLDGLERAGGGV